MITCLIRVVSGLAVGFSLGSGGDNVRSHSDHAVNHWPFAQHDAKTCLTFLEQDTRSQAFTSFVNTPNTPTHSILAFLHNILIRMLDVYGTRRAATSIRDCREHIKNASAYRFLLLPTAYCTGLFMLSQAFMFSAKMHRDHLNNSFSKKQYSFSGSPKPCFSRIVLPGK